MDPVVCTKHESAGFASSAIPDEPQTRKPEPERQMLGQPYAFHEKEWR